MWRRLLSIRCRRTTAQLLLCVSFLLGIGLARRGYQPGFLVMIGLIIFGIIGLWWRTVLGVLLVVACGLGIGCWRGGFYMHKLVEYQPYFDQKVVVQVTALQDAVYDSHSQLTFDGQNIQIDGTHLTGTMSVSGFGVTMVYAGDEMKASGKLRDGYGAKQASMSFAKLELVAHHDSIINEIRRHFASGMLSALPEPLGSFAMGILIGQRVTLPKSVKEDLLMVGLTHIIAVSGYNLTIMLHASKKLLAKQSKRLSTALSFVLIIVFLLIAGASASIVRAAIVSTLSIVTAYYGRQMKALNILAIAASMTVYANPFYLWSDISWYLSFFAFFGVMLVSPLIVARLPKRWHESVMIGVGVESISAELMSLPIVLYVFGQMSLVGLPANVLVTALVPLAMLLSTIAGLAGLLLPTLAGWLAWPAKILLNYMLDTAHLMAGLPHIFIEHLLLPLPEMLLWYGGIMTFIAALWFKTRARSAILTDREYDNS